MEIIFKTLEWICSVRETIEKETDLGRRLERKSYGATEMGRETNTFN